jgi:hypothetical protein
MNRWSVRILGLILILMFMFLFLNLKKQLTMMQRYAPAPPAKSR